MVPPVLTPVMVPPASDKGADAVAESLLCGPSRRAKTVDVGADDRATWKRPAGTWGGFLLQALRVSCL
jgi:hypothetical protein